MEAAGAGALSGHLFKNEHPICEKRTQSIAGPGWNRIFARDVGLLEWLLRCSQNEGPCIAGFRGARDDDNDGCNRARAPPPRFD